MVNTNDKLVKVRVSVVGVTPLMMNAMSDDVLEGLLTGNHKKFPKDTPPKTIAESKLHVREGKPVIPMENLFSCLVGAGRHVKNGTKQISTATSTTLPALMTIDDPHFFLVNSDGKESSWVVDKRRGRLPKDGTACCLVRPKFEDWGFKCTITIDRKNVQVNTIQSLFETAGSRIGLCDFRPACKGPFGRFTISEWEVIEGVVDDEQTDEAKGKKAA